MPQQKFISKKTLSRLVAVQKLYTANFDNNTDQDGDDSFDDCLILNEDQKVKFNKEYTKEIVDYALTNKRKVKDFLINNCKTHNFDNFELLIKSILMTATAEYMMCVEAKITIEKSLLISEYLKITASYFDKKELSLVNGILDKL